MNSRLFLFTWGVACLGAAIADGPRPAPGRGVFPLFVEERTAPGIIEAAVHAPFARKARRVDVHPELFQAGRLQPGDIMEVRLFDEAVLRAVVERAAQDVNGTLMLRGRVVSEGGGTLLLSASGGRALCEISQPALSRRYRLRHVAALDAHVLEDVDWTRDDVLRPGPPVHPPARREPAGRGAPADPQANTVVGVMVVYTPAARDWANSYGGGMPNVIAQAMQKAQEAADDSGVELSFQLVHSAEVSYTESGSHGLDLFRLKEPADGYLDEVHAWRDLYGADLVSMFTVMNDIGGLGYLLTWAGGEPEWGFSLTRVQQAGWTYTHVHEMGHNMGLHHRTDQATQPGPGLYSYSAGWRWLGTNGTRYCSVMSYSEDWAGQPVYPVGRFSNPSILYMGTATGHSVTGDNARTLREIKAVIAGYRAATSRLVRVEGDLRFGDVVLGQSSQRVATICNDGLGDLTVSGISYPAGGFSGTWSGTVPPGGSNHVTVTYAPTAAVSACAGLTVQSDATGGEPVHPVSGRGMAPFFVVITQPPGNADVPHAVSHYTLQGDAGAGVTGHLRWTNGLTGQAGSLAAATNWTLPGVALNVGSNWIAVLGTNAAGPGPAVAADAATNAPYNDGWQHGDNGGAGFGPWALTNYGANAGFFRATAGSPTNLDLAVAAWGLWANSGDTAQALRPLTEPLRASDTLLLKFENHWIEEQRSVGWSLRNAAGEYLFEFLFIGGRNNYTVNDRTLGRDTGIAFTERGLSLALDLTGPDTYRLRAGATTLTGSLRPRGDMLIRQVVAWNYGAGPGEAYNVYLTDLAITNLPAAGRATTAVVRIARAAAPQAPWIALQPSNHTAWAGETVQLLVAAGGDEPLTYRWRQDGEDRAGATNAALRLAPVRLDDAGAYDCVVSNPGGADTSQVAVVSVTELAVDGGVAAGEAGGRVVRWSSLSGRVYDVFWSADLMLPDGGFVPLETNLPATPAWNIYTDAVHEAEHRGFYRVHSRPE